MFCCKKRIKLITSKILLLLSCIYLMAGCSTPAVNLKLTCMDNCNETNAILLKVFQLREATAFELASKESLLQNEAAVLGETLISNSKFEKILIPGEEYKRSIIINEETKFIGVIADFYNPSNDNWSKIIKIDDYLEEVAISIGSNYLRIIE